MKKLAIFFLSTVLLVAIHSCKDAANSDVNQRGIPIVSAGNKTLYKFDIDEALPKGLSTEDSIATAKAYIEMWINDQLMYDKAKQNVINRGDIESMVEDYRKSLIVNSYQEQLLKEYLTKSVSESELQAYYNQNKEKFQLESNIIKGLYLKIPLESSQLDNFVKWYKQGTEAAVENIEKNTLQSAVGYEYFYDRWVNLGEITNNIPVNISDEKQFLKMNKNLEVRDSSFVYLLNIKEYTLSENEAPYDYIKNTLTEIFVEQRKADYLKQVRKDLYDKAVSNDKIKFYDR